MKKIKNFGDFLFEEINHGELPFKLTDRLITLLNSIEHKIANRILIDNMEEQSAKYTLVDYHSDNINMFTYATSAKILDYCNKKTLTPDEKTNLDFFEDNIDLDNEIWKKNRTDIRIGAFILKLYPNEYINNGKVGEDIESFGDAIKAQRTKEMGNFKIVTGQDIVKYYDKDNYEKGGDGSNLFGSCMAYKICTPYIGFYAKNDKIVRLLTLMSTDSDTIRGRALLWNLSKLDGEKTDRIFMDRIYTIKSYDVEKFKDLAKKNGWLYKKEQDMWSETPIIDPINNSTHTRSMLVSGIVDHVAYPYMDTMKFYDITKHTLTNDQKSSYDFLLESPDGGYTIYSEDYAYDHISGEIMSVTDMVWSDPLMCYLDSDTAIYNESSDEYATEEYAKNNWIYLDDDGVWIDNDKGVFIESTGRWVSKEYADKYYVSCEYNNKWYSEEDCTVSDKWGNVPNEDCIFVIIDSNIDLEEYFEDSEGNLEIGNEVDARFKGDNTYFTVHSTGLNKDFHLDNSLKRSQFSKDIKKGEF